MPGLSGERRPWGSYRVLYKENGAQVKRVMIRPGRRLSLQKHLKRSENWVVVEGKGYAVVGGKKIPVKIGSVVAVAKNKKHRMANTGRKPLVFIEVQLGRYLGEDDIIRFQDDFGRK